MSTLTTIRRRDDAAVALGGSIALGDTRHPLRPKLGCVEVEDERSATNVQSGTEPRRTSKTEWIVPWRNTNQR